MELQNTVECLVDPESAARVDEESEDKDLAQHTTPAGLHADAHWEADATDDEEDYLEYSDEECIGGEDEEDTLEKELVDSLRVLMQVAKGSSVFDAKHVRYHRGPQPNERTIRRHKAADHELKADAETSSMTFLLLRPTGFGRPGCPPLEEMPETGCCATKLMSFQHDFKEQKGWLEEALEAEHQEVIFYPKFHCELNFIKRFWCLCKHYTQEHCTYLFEGLRETLPVVIASVSTATINHYYKYCVRKMEAYANGFVYGTKEFTDKIYSGHRQVSDSSKW
jgi:hypothetical protein